MYDVRYLFVKGHMCWDKLNRCWFGGVTIGQTWPSVRELIKISLIELVQRQGFASNLELWAERERVPILVGQGLCHMESGFLKINAT